MYLEINGLSVTAVANDVVYGFVMDVTTCHDEVTDIAASLRSMVEG